MAFQMATYQFTHSRDAQVFLPIDLRRHYRPIRLIIVQLRSHHRPTCLIAQILSNRNEYKLIE